MKFGKCMLACSTALAISLILPSLAFADNDCTPNREDAVDAAASLLWSISAVDEYEERFDIPTVADSVIYLGDPYFERSDNLGEDATVWPVYFDSEKAALLYEYRNNAGSYQYRLTSCDEEIRAMEVGGVSAPKLLSSDGSGSFDGPKYLVSEQLEKLIQNGSNCQEVARGAADSASNDVSTRATALRLDVPRINQPDYHLWWVTGVASTGGYLANHAVSDKALCNAMFGRVQEGTVGDSIRALSRIGYTSSSTNIQSKYFNRTMTNAEIRRWIQNGIPFCVCCGGSELTVAAACGWSYDSSGRQVLTVMNPETSRYEALTLNGSGAQTGYGIVWNSGSIMPIGWQKPFGGSRWSYIADSGSRTYGWLKSGGYWYWFDSAGYMTTGWQKVSGKWYWMNSSGAAATGWKKIGGYWYAFDSSCAMRTGWFKDGGTWYYLRTATNTPAAGPEGAMLASGTWTIGGKAYRFDSSGACLNP